MAERDLLIRGYAQALFSVAEAEGNLEDVEDELFRFGKTVERESDLREALTDPGLPADRKKAVIRELLGAKASSQTVSLLTFVVEQGRGKDIPKITEALAELAARRRNRAVAEVRTAVPLDDDRRERLTDMLSRATGRDVELKTVVDPSVIGGVVARVDDLVFDGSIKRKLELAREQLARAR
ncbi:MAG TPA: ATP synthase F1 subunit delta [Actinomycetota bacterium]